MKSQSSASAAAQVGAKMRKEFPWLPGTLIDSLQHIAEGKVVIPNLTLDREIHSMCLITRVQNRLNSIMCEGVGHGFEHRPYCGTHVDNKIMIRSPALSAEEDAECKSMFGPLVKEMGRLEGPSSPVNKREMEPGVYTQEYYERHARSGSVTLQ